MSYLQKDVEKVHVLDVSSSQIFHHQSTDRPVNPLQSSQSELFFRTGHDIGRPKMSMEFAEMCIDMHELSMKASFPCPGEILGTIWKEIHYISTPSSVYQNIMKYSLRPHRYQTLTTELTWI